MMTLRDRQPMIVALRTMVILLLLVLSPGCISDRVVEESDRRTLIVAGSDSSPPYQFVDEDGGFDGFDVDIINAVVQEMGAVVEYRPMAWKEATDALKTGEVDIVIGMVKTPERDECYDFTDSYLHKTKNVFVLKDRYDISDIDDLDGLKVVVQEGTYAHEFLKERPDVQLVLAADKVEVIQYVVDGKADALGEDKHVILYWSFKEGYQDLIKIVGEPFGAAYSCLAVKQGDSALLADLNTALKAVKDSGQVDRIYNRWFGQPLLLGFEREKVFRVLYMVVGGLILLFLASLASNRSLQGKVQERTRELRESEATLRESEERCRSLYSATNEGVALHEVLYDETGEAADYRILDVNPAFESILGIKREDAIGAKASELFGTGEAPYLETYAKVAASGEPTAFETTFEPMAKCFRISVFSPARGRFATLFADITERKRAEEELRESQQLLERTLASLLDAVFIIDADTVEIMDCNPAASDIFGYSRQEMLGRTTAFLHVDQAALEEFRQHLYPAVEEKGFLFLPESRMKRKDGTVFPSEHSVIPLQDEQGKRIGWVSVVRDITERKRAEEALRESEERFRTVFEVAPIGMDILNAEGRPLQANRALQEMLGYTEEEFRSMVFADYTHPDDVEDSLRLVNALLEGKSDHLRMEKRYHRKDGHLVWSHVAVSAVRDANGKFLHFIAMVEDITERKRAEEALRLSEEQFSKAFHGGPLLMTISAIDDGTYFEVNENFVRVSGYSREDSIGTTSADLGLISEEDREKLRQTLLSKGKVDGMELTLQKKSGETFYCLYFVELITVAGKQRLLSIAGDITECKRAEEETAHGQRTLLALSQAAQAVQRAHTPDEVYRAIGDEVVKLGYHVVVFTLTDDQKHLSIAHTTIQPALLRTLEKLTGLSVQTFRAPLAQTIVFRRVLAERESSFDEPAADFMAGGLPRLVRPLAGRIAAMLALEQCISAPLAVGDETIGLLHVTGSGLTEADVPAVAAFANQAAIALENALLYENLRRPAEELEQRVRERTAELEHLNQGMLAILEDLRMAKERAEEADRLKTAFLATVSHELRTPLASIKGFASTLLADDVTWEPESQRDFMETIDREADRLTELIGQLLDMSRLESGTLSIDRQLCHLSDILARTEGRLTALAAQHRLVLKIAPRLPLLNVDADRIGNVLTNLVENAAKFAPAGTKITVIAQAKEGQVVVSVADEGPGIAPQHQARLFERFYRVDSELVRSQPGAGLGLAICKGLVEAHGGSIWVESDPGRGATFYFSLPAA